MALDPMNLPKFPPCGETRRENEPRVRELITRVNELKRDAERALDGRAELLDPASTLRALEEIEFGLGGLLPPIGIRVGIGPDGLPRSAEVEQREAA